MIHVLNFVIKCIATLLLVPIGAIVVIISLLMWDSRFLPLIDEMESLIWPKKI